MFDRFLRFARARQALAAGRYEEAARLADDPAIRSDRRAQDLRVAAQDALLRRAADRLTADPAAARRDLERAQRAGVGSEVLDRIAEVDAQLARAAAQRQQGCAALATVRERIAAGRLDEAEAELAAARAAIAPEAVASAATNLQTRRQAAIQRMQTAEALAAQGAFAAALAEHAAAAALDQAQAASSAASRLGAAAADWLAAGLGQDLEQGRPVAAAQRWRAAQQRWPFLSAQPSAARRGAEVATALLRALAASGPDAAAEVLAAGGEVPPLPGDGAALQQACAALAHVPTLRASGQGAELAAALATAAAALATAGHSAPALAAAAAAAQQQWQQAEAEVARGRDLMAQGDFAAARAALATVLAAWPQHAGARQHLAALEAAVGERQARLAAARTAAAAGRLAFAYAQALAEAVPGPAGDEARQLAGELQRQLAFVQRGLDAARAELAAATSAAACERVRQQLEALATVQSDHPELPALRAQLEHERDQCAAVATAEAALAQDRPQAAAAAMAAAFAPTALDAAAADATASSRMAARWLPVALGLVRAAERAALAGQVVAARSWLAACAALAGRHSALREGIAQVEHRLAQQAVSAAAAVARGQAALAARDLPAAAAACAQALVHEADGGAAGGLHAAVNQVRIHAAHVDRIAALAAAGDAEAARAAAADLAPTPPLLRTRIFDMKQSLAKAQGLDGPFLLRVDEGGEFLVLRGESLTIGNVREGNADLPVLAAIAGRHARVTRTLSFHGGMQDAIEAEAGPVQVGGQSVPRHRLRSGDRVALGALQLGYAVPSSRSLTALLTLHGGFQVAGTDRVLLLKDRGRDGRILIGPGPDVHVRLAAAAAEVEVFAHTTGQIRVRCDADGTIDGRPFRGEHPVDPGAMVQVAGVAFVLQPWAGPR